MKKRAAIAMEQVVVAAIVLIVMVVVIAIFGTQIREYAKGFREVSNFTKDIKAGTACKSFMSDKFCQDTCTNTDNFYYETLPKPRGGWSDCEKDQNCCERIKKDKDDE